MIIEQNRESADVLYQLADYLPLILRIMAEQTQHVYKTYQTLQDDLGPHRDVFNEILLNIRAVISETGDTVDELSDIFRKCADRIMEIEDSGLDQPILKLKRKYR